MRRLHVIASSALVLSIAAPGQQYTFTHFAGSRGGSGSFDGPAAEARFRGPMAIAVDGAGNVYLADMLNQTIRKLDATTGMVATLAGLAGSKGSQDGLGGAARFWEPRALAASPTGVVYVADAANNTIRKVTPAGEVSTLAGKAGYGGSTDGPGTEARFSTPSSLALDSSGNLYVADEFNYTVRKISPGGTVTTLAGSPGASGCAEGVGSAARFSTPQGIAVDHAGNVYVANTNCYTVSKITPQGAVTTLAGLANQFGDADGVGSAARFREPQGLAVDGAGNVFVADAYNETIRKITPAGAVSTIAGKTRTTGSADGPGGTARFNYPVGIAADGSGSLYVADTFNETVRKIDASGLVSTMAGLAPVSGSADGQGASAQFTFPSGIAVDASGNVYVADMDAHTIRKITPSGLVTTLAGLAGSGGYADGTGSAARFFHPADVTVDRSGNVYVADTGSNHCIRKITPAGVVTTLAGQHFSPGNVDGTGSAARFDGPQGITVDSAGVVYVADTNNNAIRRITPAGEVTTLAGSAGPPEHVCDDGPGSQARFYRPLGVTVDASGVVYVADTSNQLIRKITPDVHVTTLAGGCWYSGSQDGAGAAARFYYPSGVNAASGTLFVADTWNSTLRKITPGGAVTTLAGSADPSQRGNVDATGTAARFNYPFGVAVDPSGNLYVADGNNLAIRKGTPALPDTATIDSAVGFLGYPRRLGAFPETATSWAWRQTRIPAGSTAHLSSTSVRDPVFVPDVPDFYQFELTAEDASGAKSITFVDLEVTACTNPAAGSGSAPALCIDDVPGDARFRASVTWSTTQGGNDGLPHGGSPISTAPLGIRRGGLFWFFQPDNPEMLLKVLNGCGVNGKYWVFTSAGTNVGLTTTVTDSVTGLAKTYSNPDRTPAVPVQDTGAFACAAGGLVAGTAAASSWPGPLPAAPPRQEVTAAAGCVPSATTLCIDDVPGDRRFSVSVDYATSQGGGQAGSGSAISTASVGVGRGGLFWFFQADNPEMLVKVLNGCSVNERFWVFSSAGTNVGVTTRVTDTVTGAVVTYANPDLTPAVPVQDTAAFRCN